MTRPVIKAVSEQYQNKILHCYFPFDIAFIVKRYLKKIQPDLCLLLETAPFTKIVLSGMIRNNKLNYIGWQYLVTALLGMLQ
jgi:3-deoxy-D-manno-octulosonic-acid transferase